MKRLLACVLVIGCLFPCAAANAQEIPEMPAATKKHQWLQKFVGEWSVNQTAKMGPGQPEMKSSGTIVSRRLGDFWVINELKSEMLGTTVTGIQTIGYDSKKEKYVGTWVDSMTDYIWRYEGTVDATGMILTLNAEGPDMSVEGKTTQYQDVYEFTSENEINVYSKMLGDDGKWVTFMSGKGTRKK